jgi:hypothetical protein
MADCRSGAASASLLGRFASPSSDGRLPQFDGRLSWLDAIEMGKTLSVERASKNHSVTQLHLVGRVSDRLNIRVVVVDFEEVRQIADLARRQHDETRASDSFPFFWIVMTFKNRSSGPPSVISPSFNWMNAPPQLSVNSFLALIRTVPLTLATVTSLFATNDIASL